MCSTLCSCSKNTDITRSQGIQRRVTEAMGLCAPNTATYVAFILSEKVVTPTAEYPDPTSAVLSTVHVSLYFIHDSLICELLNGYLLLCKYV